MGTGRRAVQQLREFLARQLVPGDQVMLATYDLGLHVRLPFTDDPAALAAALDRVETACRSRGTRTTARGWRPFGR